MSQFNRHLNRSYRNREIARLADTQAAINGIKLIHHKLHNGVELFVRQFNEQG